MSETSNESTEVVRADVPGAKDSDLAKITLAHPLSRPEDLRTLGLPDDAPMPVGSTIMIRKDHAKSLIGSGYAAGVDPNDGAAVRAALRNEQPKVEAVEPSQENQALAEQNAALGDQAAEGDAAGVSTAAEAAQSGGVTDGDADSGESVSGKAETPASTAAKAGKAGAAAKTAASGSSS